MLQEKTGKRVVVLKKIKKMITIDETLIQRFKNKIKKENGCWLWTSTLNWKGYGRFMICQNGLTYQPHAHRVSYLIHYGNIPKVMTVHHKCHNKKCVNPEHLELKTNLENIMEGNCWSAVNARKTHCIYGHPFSDENTFLYFKYKNGKNYRIRGCRECRILYHRNWRLKKKTRIK